MTDDQYCEIMGKARTLLKTQGVLCLKIIFPSEKMEQRAAIHSYGTFYDKRKGRFVYIMIDTDLYSPMKEVQDILDRACDCNAVSIEIM